MSSVEPNQKPKKKTFSNEETLPRLPVPPLDQTLQKYLQTILPYMTTNQQQEQEQQQQQQQQLKHSRSLIEDFAKTQGPELQKLLLQRDQKEKNSWLETWWNNIAYSEDRSSIVINCSFLLRLSNPTKGISQLQRAAVLSRCYLSLKEAFETETYPPFEVKGTPFSMSAHQNFLASLRVPHQQRDTNSVSALKEARTIAVARKEKLFIIPCYHSDNTPLSPLEFQKALEQVVEIADKEEREEFPIGLFTILERTTWANIRDILVRKQQNVESFRELTSAIALICLDDKLALDESDRVELFLSGGGRHRCSGNRFFDKTFQLIVDPAAYIGICGEHSRIDGLPTLTTHNWILQQEEVWLKSLLGDEKGRTKSFAGPKKLQWDLSEVKSYFQPSCHFLDYHLSNFCVQYTQFKDFGATQIKKFKCSPDAFVQLALQLAQYRLHGKFVGTYESVSMGRFKAGRTETGRSVSVHSVRFVLDMLSDLPAEKKRESLQVAAKAHTDYLREASNGNGIDRHLLGLKLLTLQQNRPLHGLYTDPLYSYSSTWRLSTSQLESEIEGVSFAFGPVVVDGYGFAYNIKAKEISFNISHFPSYGKTNSVHLAKLVVDSLRQMEAVCALPAPKL